MLRRRSTPRSYVRFNDEGVFDESSLKKLVNIVFSKPSSSESKIKENICPSCLKSLVKGSKVIGMSCMHRIKSHVKIVKVLKGCGHAFCKRCVAMVISKSKGCFVCHKECKEKDHILLKSEGTGFVGSGGKVEVVKEGIAFQ